MSSQAGSFRTQQCVPFAEVLLQIQEEPTDQLAAFSDSGEEYNGMVDSQFDFEEEMSLQLTTSDSDRCSEVPVYLLCFWVTCFSHGQEHKL